jgi:hypothetical protein
MNSHCAAERAWPAGPFPKTVHVPAPRPFDRPAVPPPTFAGRHPAGSTTDTTSVTDVDVKDVGSSAHLVRRNEVASRMSGRIRDRRPQLKENELFSFIQTGPVVLIAPDSALVGFRPTPWPHNPEPNRACSIIPQNLRQNLVAALLWHADRCP